jgi:hypothetical protein
MAPPFLTLGLDGEVRPKNAASAIDGQTVLKAVGSTLL